MVSKGVWLLTTWREVWFLQKCKFWCWKANNSGILPNGLWAQLWVECFHLTQMSEFFSFIPTALDSNWTYCQAKGKAWKLASSARRSFQLLRCNCSVPEGQAHCALRKVRQGDVNKYHDVSWMFHEVEEIDLSLASSWILLNAELVRGQNAGRWARHGWMSYSSLCRAASCPMSWEIWSQELYSFCWQCNVALEIRCLTRWLQILFRSVRVLCRALVFTHLRFKKKTGEASLAQFSHFGFVKLSLKPLPCLSFQDATCWRTRKLASS